MNTTTQTLQFEQNWLRQTPSASLPGAKNLKKERRQAIVMSNPTYPYCIIQNKSTRVPNKFRLSKEVEWLMNELDFETEHNSVSELPYLSSECLPSSDTASVDTPSLVSDSGSSIPGSSEVDNEEYFEIDSYYYGRYENGEGNKDTPDNHSKTYKKLDRYSILKDFVSIPSPEARLAGLLELEKENKNPINNAPIDPSSQVDFDPSEYFWDVYPQPLYVYDGHLKTKFVSASVMTQHRLKTESKAKKEKNAMLKRVFGCMKN
jgi:hypothetical protein